MSILIKGGRVIDPQNKIDAVLDILIEGEQISKVAENIQAQAETIIDAAHKIVAPGIIDMHVHLREPGKENVEKRYDQDTQYITMQYQHVKIRIRIMELRELLKVSRYLERPAMKKIIVHLVDIRGIRHRKIGNRCI